MKYKGRTVLMAAVIVAAFIGLGVRLAFLHLKPSPGTLERIGNGRHLEQEIRGPRGRVLDRNGNIFAVDIAAKHVCADPKFIFEHGDIQAVCTALAEHLSLDRTALWKLLDQPKRQYVRIKKFMRKEMIEPLQQMHLKGVIFEDVPIRE